MGVWISNQYGQLGPPSEEKKHMYVINMGTKCQSMWIDGFVGVFNFLLDSYQIFGQTLVCSGTAAMLCSCDMI